MSEKLKKKLEEIKRAGGIPEVKDAPAGAYTYDKMIVIWLDRGGSKKFLWQINLWDSKAEKIVGVY